MVRNLVLAAVVVGVGAPLVSAGGPGNPSSYPMPGAPQEMRIVVPEAPSARVITDGQFLPGEWEGAFQSRISEDFDVYLLADSVNLCIGFRFLHEVEATFGAELYLAVNDGEFLNLHSTGALGEGKNGFSAGLGSPAFTVGRTTGWESNVAKRPVRAQGKEYKISRRKLPGAGARVAAVMMVANSDMRETANFPEHFSFESPAGWVALVLPWDAHGRTHPPLDQ